MKADAPQKAGKPAILEPKLSTFALPVNIDLKVLADTLNKSLEGPLYIDDSFDNNGGDDIKIVIQKTGEIRLKADGEYIYYDVPLHAKIEAREEVLFVKVNAKTTCDIRVSFKTKLDFSEDWRLQTKTEAVGYKVLNSPKLDFGVIQFPAKKILELVLDNFLDDAANAIDDEIPNNFDARSYVDEMWENVKEPVLVDEEYGTWIYMKPEHFFYTPLEGKEKKVSFSIGVEAYMDAVTGHKPDVSLPTELPKLLKVQKDDLDFDIFLKTELYYFKMNEILQKDLVGYEYNYGKKKKIVITDAEVYGNGDELVLKIDFDGNVSGEVYMTGQPKYDTITQELYLDDFEFDIKSEQAIVKIADWLLSGTFKKQMNN